MSLNMEPDGVLLHSVFSELRRRWLSEESGRTSHQLATKFNVSPQRVSQWATGTDGRKPPWSAILKLCDELGYVVLVTPSNVYLRRVGGDVAAA